MTSDFFFFNDTATTEIYTLSLHDALPIYVLREGRLAREWHPLDQDQVWLHGAPVKLQRARSAPRSLQEVQQGLDRKSTRLNSSHANISYAVFCLKKKNTITIRTNTLLSS